MLAGFNGVGQINNRARLVLGLVTVLGGLPFWHFLGPLSLAILSCIGAINTGDDFSHRSGRNGEFCVAVGHVARTAGIPAYCMLAYSGLTLIGSKVKRSKGTSSLTTDLTVYA